MPALVEYSDVQHAHTVCLDKFLCQSEGQSARPRLARAWAIRKVESIPSQVSLLLHTPTADGQPPDGYSKTKPLLGAIALLSVATSRRASGISGAFPSTFRAHHMLYQIVLKELRVRGPLAGAAGTKPAAPLRTGMLSLGNLLSSRRIGAHVSAGVVLMPFSAAYAFVATTSSRTGCSCD